MSKPIVQIENLSKCYRIQHESRERYSSLREVIAKKMQSIFNRSSLRHTIGSFEDFWALNDVTFDIQEGEVVGIVGRNGAGKSTLLKILSRITEPSAGRVTLRGRVASLLEVGTGFHPEMTGRENIFLNGSILGMSRTEIKRKFDEIVAFAEVEKFLDTPVKRYSSGMYVRLAFAVAAHLEPEILIVDEVLAVGDAEFQKKCLGKMHDVSAKEGRTVLFVSHNMSVIQHLCSRAILLRSGRIVADGPVNEVIGRLLSDARGGSRICIADWQDRINSGEARILELQMTDGCGNSAIKLGGELKIRISSQFDTVLKNPTFGVIIHDSTGTAILDIRSVHDGLSLGAASGHVTIEVAIPTLNLYPGRYLLSPWIMDSACKRDIDFPRMCATMDVDPASGPHGDLMLDGNWGKYFVPSSWKSVSAK